MTRYQHTQWSIWTLAIGGVTVLVAVVFAIAGWGNALGGVWWYAILGFVAVVLAVASRLTVTVDDTAVTAAFGWGWPHRRIALVDVAATNRRRVRWYHGWGIRKVAGGTMYNTSGFDAVELQLRSGGVFWIGTDEPDALLGALTVGDHA